MGNHKQKEYYVYDSTPAWSKRGQMRDILIPQLMAFDKNLFTGLCHVADEMSEMYEEVQSRVKKVIKNIIIITPQSAQLVCNEYSNDKYINDGIYINMDNENVSKTQIDVSNYASGIYLVNVLSNERQLYTQKLIKN